MGIRLITGLNYIFKAYNKKMDYLAITIPDRNPQCSVLQTPREHAKDEPMKFCCPRGHYLEVGNGAICRRADDKSWCVPWRYENGICEHPYHSFNNQPYYNVSKFVTRQWPRTASQITKHLK